jgi:hypothetical protein
MEFDLSALKTNDLISETLNLLGLPDGRYAVPNSESRLKLRVSRGAEDSKWANYIFVRDAAQYGHRRLYGMQRPGSYYHGDCEEELNIILKDPVSASIAYGKLTGHCGVCGRPLENQESLDRGIGPVCAERLGVI